MTDLTETQRRSLVVALRAAQWALDDVAHGVPTGRVTAQQWAELASNLDHLRDLVRQVGAGEPPGILGT
jgi:hypothetical protein